MRTSPASRTSIFPAGQSKTPAVVCFAFPGLPPARPSRISIARTHAGVDEPTAERADAVEAAIDPLGAAAEGCPREPPDGVASEADREEVSSSFPNGCCDRPHRALLVRRLAAGAERQLEGEKADDAVDGGAGQEPERANHSNGRLATTRSPRPSPRGGGSRRPPSDLRDRGRHLAESFSRGPGSNPGGSERPARPLGEGFGLHARLALLLDDPVALVALDDLLEIGARVRPVGEDEEPPARRSDALYSPAVSATTLEHSARRTRTRTLRPPLAVESGPAALLASACSRSLRRRKRSSFSAAATRDSRCVIGRGRRGPGSRRCAAPAGYRRRRSPRRPLVTAIRPRRSRPRGRSRARRGSRGRHRTRRRALRRSRPAALRRRARDPVGPGERLLVVGEPIQEALPEDRDDHLDGVVLARDVVRARAPSLDGAHDEDVARGAVHLVQRRLTR